MYIYKHKYLPNVTAVVYAENGDAVPLARVKPDTVYYNKRKYIGLPIADTMLVPTIDSHRVASVVTAVLGNDGYVYTCT